MMLQVATTLKDPDLRRRMVYLDVKHDKFLAELADKRRINKSAIVRQLVDELMDDTLLS